MRSPFRQSLISSHIFYVEQAKKKLLSQFGDLEHEAKIATGQWLAQHSIQINPTLEYDESFYDCEASLTLGYLNQLTEMRDQTRLSVVAGMFYEWEKQLRTWLVSEYKQLLLGEKPTFNALNAKIEDLFKKLDKYYWPVLNTTYAEKILACHSVVNVYKHGNGNSFRNLRERYPEYLHDPFNGGDELFSMGINYLNYMNLIVTDIHIQEFSDAIVEFWKNAPESVTR
jgi:hypothetical protein